LSSSSLFKHKNFSRLFFASSISELGSFVTETGLMLYLFSLTGDSKSWLGISKSTFILSYTLGTFVGGGLRDYKNFKKILLFSNAIRVPLLVFMIYSNNPTILVTLSGVIAFFQGIFTPLRRALTNIFVPDKKIKKANSLTSTTYAALHLICPYIGAIVYTRIGTITPIFLGDLLTYLIGFILIIFISDIKKSHQLETNQKKGFLFDWKFLEKNPLIKTMSIQYAIVGMMVGILIPLLLPYTLHFLNRSKEDYGLVMFCFGLGGLFGGLISNKLSDFYSSNKLSVIGFFIEANMLLIWSQFQNFYVACFLLIFWGTIVFVRIPAQFNFISETIPTKDLAMAHSIVQICFVIPNFLGGLLVALLGDLFQAREIYIYSGIIFTMISIVRFFLPTTKKFYQYSPKQIKRELIE